MESVDVRAASGGSDRVSQDSVNLAQCALSSRFEMKKQPKSAMDSAIEQMKREEETRKLAPDAYRLSTMSEAMINGHYRRGKSTMSTSDVIRYFSETRNRRIRELDFSDIDGRTGLTVEEDEECLALDAKEESREGFSVRVKTVAKTFGKNLATSAPTWFNGSRADTSRETRRFPLSAFAALLAVAMSLMLIVASAVMVNRAENSVSELRRELDAVSSEVAEMTASFQVQSDLREIYRIATEEYGMVSEEYIKTEYISLDSEESVEAFEEERQTNISLDAILSALGLKK